MLQEKIINRKYITFFIVFNLILSFLLFIIGFFHESSSTEDGTSISIIGFISLLLLGFFVWQHYKITNNYLNYNIIFMLFVYLFTFGQIILYSFGVSTKALSVFRISSMAEIYWASSFALKCFIFFQIGSLLPYYRKTKQTKEEESINKKEDKGISTSIRVVAIVLFLVSVIPYAVWLAERFSISTSLGYGALYEQESGSNTFLYLVKMFIPSVFLLLYSVNNKSTKRLLKGLLLVLALINLIIGSRGNAMSIVTILIVYIYTFEKKMNKAAFIKIAVTALVAMILIPTVAAFRSTTGKNLQGFSDAMNTTLEDSDNNFVVKTVSELGYSIHPIILTRKLIPSVQNFRYGESYVSDIMMAIPSFLMGGYSFASKAALDIWLQKTLNMSYGPGYSLFAETYYNFGEYFGILFSLVLGLFFSSVFDLDRRFANNRVIPIFTLIFLFNSVIIIRFPMHATIRNLLYMYIIPYFLIKLIYERRFNYDGQK